MEASQEAARVKKGRPVVVGVLLGIGALLTVVAVFSIWINRQALNTDYWVGTSGKLLANEEVQQQLSTYLSDQIFANVDVESKIQGVLPPALEPLAAPATGALQDAAPQVAQRVLASSRVQALWAEANRNAHERLLQVIDGGGPAVSTSGGEVVLNLHAIVTAVEDRLGISGAISAKLPPDAGKITVMKADQLSTVQKVAKVVRRLPVVLTLLLLIVYGLAIYLAGPRRRQALRSVGLWFIVAGVLALIIRRLAGGHVVDALATTEAVHPATQATWDIGTSLLVTVASSAIAFGILVVIGAWLAGTTRLAAAIRREAAPYVEDNRAGAYAIAGAVFLALIAWAPIAAFRKPFGILLFAVLMAAGAEIFRRQILREFPEGVRPESAPVLERLKGLAPGGGGQAAPEPEDRELDRLERLTALHKSGGLTDEEFAAAKADALTKT
jgi:hypothetical protein